MTEYGYIVFSYTKNEWIAKQIAWFTDSKWSHCFFTVPPMLGREMVMEAVAGGVSVAQFDLCYRANIDQAYEVYRFKISQENIDQAICKTMDLFEVAYGFLHYVWFIYRTICKKLGKDIKSQDNWASKNGEVCSDLLRHYIEASGYKSLFEGYGQDSAAPQDIYDIVLAHPELFELTEKKA